MLSRLLAGGLLAAVPLLACRAADNLSLSGTWRFALDRQDAGTAGRWFSRDLPDRIRLPGILQGQGYGDLISPATPWVETLGDAWWRLQPEALRARFSSPGHTKVPFLSQPPRHYLGRAWYQRDLEVPEGWRGRRLELFLERPHWETAVWLDDRFAGTDRSLGAPHRHALGLVAPGRHRLTLRIDNRMLLHDPSGDGHMPDAHSVSDALGAAWNGVVGRIEVRASSPVWLDDVQVYPRLSDGTALVRVRIGNATGRAGAGQLAAGGAAIAAAWDASGGGAELRIPLPDARPWDEYHPRLQELSVSLRGADADDARRVRFGLREVTARGRELLINGRPVNLRMTHFGGDFPLTGYPATDVASWRRLIAVCQAYGLNGMRFHSWCPPEAAFTAADEMGFYLQPECSLWSPLSPGNVYARFLEAETARLLAAYGNHPSFLLLSPSNEPAGRYVEVTPAWARRWHERDPRRLYSAGTGWSNPAQVTGGAQYAVLVRYQGHELRNRTGWFGADYGAATARVAIPVLAHEVGQWCAYPDFRVRQAFTGYLQPGNFDIFHYLAQREGVLDQDRAFAVASGRFQIACYKEEIEANLRTPGLAGYQLLDLHDYLGQGTALIGILDAFWRSKGDTTPEAFRRFNGAVVPLVRLRRRTFTTGERLRAAAELYQFSDGPLAPAQPYWEVRDAAGRTRARGAWAARTMPRGKNLPLGALDIDLGALPAPAAYRLVAGITYRRSGSLAIERAENDWNFWVYPQAVSAAVPPGIVICHRWPEADAVLAAGGRVLYCPGPGALDPARCPPLQAVPVFWNIQMTVRPPRNPVPRFDAMLGLWCDAKHPALAEFPTTDACDWQWTPLIVGVRSVNLEGAPASLRPIVAAIDDWNRNWRLAVLFEARVGPGRLLVSAIDVDQPAPPPGLRQWRRSLLDYLASPRFAPSTALTPGQARRLWRVTRAAPPGRRLPDPDLDAGS